MCSGLSHSLLLQSIKLLLLIFNFFRSFETPLGVIDYVLMFFVAMEKSGCIINEAASAATKPSFLSQNSKIPFDWPLMTALTLHQS